MIGGIPTAIVSGGQLADLMVAACLRQRLDPSRSATIVFSSNGQAVSMAGSDRRFRAQLLQADIIHADGEVIVAASRLLTRTPIPERTATTDFIHAAAAAGQAPGLRFYLLGSTEDVNAAAARRLLALYPGITIAGRHHGYFPDGDEAAICEQINASNADVVWVGLGKPREQAFCVENRHRIQAGWIITCGGCFNFLSGSYTRAPQWMQRTGLEWLHRMFSGPRYLIWRYLITNPHALYLIATRTRRALI
jgi:N-acetylglucosaminyldiphosphoundecaprenol N-acetyl-beta-D-mannosaminyltransferase